MMQFPGPRRYVARKGVHGDPCIDLEEQQWVRLETVARAASMEDAERIVQRLNRLAELEPGIWK